jgi:hypothetical protein
MSDSPGPQGDATIAMYPIPAQVRSTLLSSTTRTGKTIPYLIVPFPFPGSIRSKEQ